MKKITEYALVSTNPHNEFVEIINKMIQKGWQPLGSAVCDKGYFQTMVKYEDEPLEISGCMEEKHVCRFSLIKKFNVKENHYDSGGGHTSTETVTIYQCPVCKAIE